MGAIEKKCSFCDGSGTAGSTQEPRVCGPCGGTGKESFGTVNDNRIYNALKKIAKKLDVELDEE